MDKINKARLSKKKKESTKKGSSVHIDVPEYLKAPHVTGSSRRVKRYGSIGGGFVAPSIVGGNDRFDGGKHNIATKGSSQCTYYLVFSYKCCLSFFCVASESEASQQHVGGAAGQFVGS